MVCTYKALFNGKSKFGVRGGTHPVDTAGIVLDDAHAAFSLVRDSFTLNINSGSDRDRYENLAGLFRESFKELDRLGTFDDILSGSEYATLEVPYWAWLDKVDAVRAQLKTDSEKHKFEWPLLRDNLYCCHALISKHCVSITPVLPLVNMIPTFQEASRRIYMSATIADDSELIRTFDTDPNAVKNVLKSKSLAGVSERMILIPDLMPFDFDVRDSIVKLLKMTAARKIGAIVLVSSDELAKKWSDAGDVVIGSENVDGYVMRLQRGDFFGPVTFSNRYDGIDLPGNSCRLLVMSGMPAGTSAYELFKAGALHTSDTITRMISQRIEQGIGRGARGAGDHCVIILTGSDITSWISKHINFQFLTSPTRAQLQIGTEISKEIKNFDDLVSTIERSYVRDKEWVGYHAETLAELVTDEQRDSNDAFVASLERKALSLWNDSYNEKAVSTIERGILECVELDAYSAPSFH